MHYRHLRGVAQLNTTVAAFSREDPSREHLELVVRHSLCALGSDKREGGQLVRVLQVSTVLNLHANRQSEPLGESDRVDSTDQFHILWELDVVAIENLDSQSEVSSLWLHGIRWDVQL